MAERGFEKFVSKVEEQRVATESIINTVHQTLNASASVSISDLANRIDIQFTECKTTTDSKIADIHCEILQLHDGG